MANLRLSLLDLAAVVEGATIADALARTTEAAIAAERFGYERFWLAEHHNMVGVASAATAVVIGHVAAATSTIRVGAGGIMLPNHAPYVIAEQFGTLCALFPGRIDLGLGRAPGTDTAAARALRHRPATPEAYPRDVVELLGYFKPSVKGQAIVAVPGAGSELPVWILGSSPFSAQLAAHLGLPYAFASHFAPAAMMQSLALYHQQFRPSARLDAPYVMVAANAIAADTESHARFLATTHERVFLSLRHGRPEQARPPGELTMTPMERQMLDSVLSCSFAGTAAQVRAGLRDLQATTQANELIITCHVYDHDERMRALERIATG